MFRNLILSKGKCSSITSDMAVNGQPPAPEDAATAAANTPHLSVFPLHGGTENRSSQVLQSTPIMNACLSFIKHLMTYGDKSYIQDAVCSRFSLNRIMDAREMLFKHSTPEDKYAYRGPNKVTNVRDRCIHAFEGVYTKFVEIDSLGKMPIIACPSEDLGLLLSLNNDTVVVDDRFRSIETEIREMKRTFHAFTATVNSNNPYPPINAAPSIPTVPRVRVLSESSKRRRTEEGEVREVSVSESAVEADATVEDSQFELSREQRKRLSRRAYSEKVKQAAPTEKSQVTKQSNTNSYRSKAIWGKSTTGNSDLLSGPPPEIFMFNCRRSVEEANVKEHFHKLGITLQNAEKVSHKDARKHSFVLTMDKRDDYNKILSGECTPEDVALRRYYRRRVSKENNAVSSDVIRNFLNTDHEDITAMEVSTANNISRSIESAAAETNNSQNGGDTTD